MKALKVIAVLILAISLVGVVSAAENETNDIMPISANPADANETPSVNLTNETQKVIPAEIAFVRNVSEEKFSVNNLGQEYAVNDSTYYYLNMKAFDAYDACSGSAGDLYEDVLVVAYSNNTIKVFDLSNDSEIVPQNGLSWRYCLGNYICLDNYYTTTPADAGKEEEEEEEDPSGVPVYYLNSKDGFPGLVKLSAEITALYDNAAIFILDRGSWDENTVLELRELYPNNTIVIVEWYTESSE